MLQLNNLESLSKKRKRVGRGGSRGGHSGRGKDGQKARTGSNSELKASFEGGQMPLARRLPRRGFTNISRTEYQIIDLDQLESRFEEGSVITKKDFVAHGFIKAKGRSLIKVLGSGQLTKKLTVHADAFSKSAVEAIKKVGGSVEVIKETNRGGAAS